MWVLAPSSYQTQRDACRFLTPKQGNHKLGYGMSPQVGLHSWISGIFKLWNPCWSWIPEGKELETPPGLYPPEATSVSERCLGYPSRLDPPPFRTARSAQHQRSQHGAPMVQGRRCKGIHQMDRLAIPRVNASIGKLWKAASRDCCTQRHSSSAQRCLIRRAACCPTWLHRNQTFFHNAM